MSNNPYQSPSDNAPRRPWHRRPAPALVAALVCYGAAVLVTNGVRLTYGADDFSDAYAQRVPPAVQAIVRALSFVLVSASVVCLATAAVLGVRARRARR